MKKSKIVGIGTAAALAAVLAMGLAGCGTQAEQPQQSQLSQPQVTGQSINTDALAQSNAQANNNEGVVGHWSFAGAKVGGMDVRGSYSDFGLAGDVSVDINQNGIYTMAVMGNSVSGSWSQTGPVITFEVPNTAEFATGTIATGTIADDETMELSVFSFPEGQVIILQHDGATQAASGETQSTQSSGETVLVDDEVCKITLAGWDDSEKQKYGTGAVKLKFEIVNKTDQNLSFDIDDVYINDHSEDLWGMADIKSGKSGSLTADSYELEAIPTPGTTEVTIAVHDDTYYEVASYDLTL